MPKGGKIMPGPPKKPTNLKVLEGMLRSRDKINEPKPRPIAPQAPAWLPTAAKKEWKRLAPELERVGCLTAVDGPAFAMMLLHLSNAVEAAKALKKDGLLIKDDEHKNADGTAALRKHPACQILRDNSQAFKAYSDLFGLSPAARARIDLPTENEDEDPMEALLKKAINKTK
jgi:P27 family predicted phage terminase small subunit